MGISGAVKYVQTTPGLWVIVRGDSDSTTVNISFDGVPYVFVTGDSLVLTVKATADAESAVLTKAYTTNAVTLTPSDTAGIEVGEYVYDLELQLANGIRKTIISQGKFILRQEVTANG